jgi:eukaryotic-like serine/threonine-protein kinase
VTHPELDELGADPLPPEVIVHLDRCPECRDAREAWVGNGEIDRTLPAEAALDRFTILGLLGHGGMGDVYLGRDDTLDREVAIKVLRADLAVRDRREMLLEEARITAVLQHPSIVPIYRVGHLRDGRPFYVMKRIEGRSLRELLAEPLLRRRGVGFVARACDAVAYAHAAGVIHGDLKPENVLIGQYDELTLLDFGLALRVGNPRSSRAGTPPYMAPEMAAGRPATEATDVYALGALLYEVLTGRSPDGACDPTEAPPPLASACRAAVSSEPASRPTAAAFAQELRGWLDGERRTDEARAVLRGAEELRTTVEGARNLARSLRRRADEELANVPAYEAVEKKVRAWELLDQAAEAEARSLEMDLDLQQALVSALELDPELPEARDELASYRKTRLIDAERRGDHREIRRVRRVLEADPVTSSWLAAPTTIHIRSSTPDARVFAMEGRVEARRWTASEERDLGPAPLRTELPPGRWRIEVRAPGRDTAVFPVQLARAGSLDAELELPEPVPGARWVPPGWFTAGGDEEAADGLSARRVWVDGFHMQVHPVTVAEYVRFLNAISPDAAERYQPMETAGYATEPRPVLRRSEKDFVPEALPHDGSVWEPDAPVVLVDYPSVSAYAAWWSQETGRAWRLPHDLEWEKAARGDDGRTFPWGTQQDPAFANMLKSHRSTPCRTGIRTFPLDESPYGIRGLGGNVRDWCCNEYHRDGDVAAGQKLLQVKAAGEQVPWIMVRGGAWFNNERWCRSASRFVSAPDHRTTSAGFRLLSPAGSSPPTSQYQSASRWSSGMWSASA